MYPMPIELRALRRQRTSLPPTARRPPPLPLSQGLLCSRLLSTMSDEYEEPYEQEEEQPGEEEQEAEEMDEQEEAERCGFTADEAGATAHSVQH